MANFTLYVFYSNKIMFDKSIKLPSIKICHIFSNIIFNI